MQHNFDISALASAPADPVGDPTVVDVLKQILETQREQLAQLRATAAAHDAAARWRSLLARWTTDFPELPQACRRALPILEKAYGAIISALVEELGDNGDEALENDFTLQDFLDRYGMRLGQLGNILNLVGPLAEASQQNESS